MTDSLLDDLDTNTLDLQEPEEINLEPASHKQNNSSLKLKRRRTIEDFIEEKRLMDELKDYDFDD